jgi:hypothetical protein
MTKFYGTVAETEYDGLIAGAEPAADIFSVTIAHGTSAKTLKRGTILNNAAGAYAILADDVTVSATTDAIATAYRTGHFVRQFVKSENGAAVTAVQEDRLRLYGILLSDAANA